MSLERLFQWILAKVGAQWSGSIFLELEKGRLKKLTVKRTLIKDEDFEEN